MRSLLESFPDCSFLFRPNPGSRNRRQFCSCPIAMTMHTIIWKSFRNAEEAIEIAKYDDAGNYRPLKTAPNLRHGWRMELGTPEELKRALDHFYPGRVAIFAAWQRGQLRTTSLRETLDRQSGMYRIAANISDAQIDDLVAHFCRSNGGCLRTILWKRDQSGAIASTKLSKQKFDPSYDQTRALIGRAADRPRLQFRFFARNRAIFWWPHAGKL